MSGSLSKFNTTANYWQIFPQMRIIEPFKTFYKLDKSKSKSMSSKIMWAIAMLLDVEDNKLALYSEDDRKLVIAEDYLEKKNFDWTKKKKIIDAYEKTVLTHAKRALLIQRRKTDERTKFLSGVSYSLENAKELDGLLSNTEKFLAILKRLEEAVSLEGNNGNKKGGLSESLSEQGVI